MSRLICGITEFFAERAITGAGVVAVSGGADSVALLRGLVLANIPVATMAHLNHQLRGAESDADEAFVIELAQQLKLNYFTSRVDLGAFAASRKQNLEAAARDYRYDFLTDVAQRFGASWIATGHTLNDQAETVLHRLIRGAGLQGLRGIAPVREGNPPVIRPLLQVTRTEVVDFLHELNQPYRTDSTNTDLAFTRNRIRSELVPLLQSFNPEVLAALSRTAEQCEEAQAFIEEQVRAAWVQCEKPRAGKRVILDSLTLQALPRLLRVNLLRQIWTREGWPLGGMTARHWERLQSLTVGHYPGGVELRRTATVVQLGPQS